MELNGLSKVNLGCGKTPKVGYINIDYDINVPCDIYADLEKPIPLSDNSASLIEARQVCEHLDNFVSFMFECHRILAVGGTLEISVPLFPCVAALADPTHKRFFVIDTFILFGHTIGDSNFPGRELFNIKSIEVIKWRFKHEKLESAGTYFSELIVKMEKVEKSFWLTEQKDRYPVNIYAKDWK